MILAIFDFGMTFWRTLILWLAISCFGGESLLAQDSLDAKYISPRVVAISVEYNDGQDWVPAEKGKGTGFLIHPKGYLLSAKHLVPAILIADKESWPRIRIAGQIGGRDTEKMQLEIVDAHPSRDALLLRLKRRSVNPSEYCELSRQFELNFEELTTVGFPFGEGYDGTVKVVKAHLFSELAEGAQFGEVKGDLAGGFSGGPVFLKKKVVGLVESWNAAKGTHKFVPIRSLKSWISESIQMRHAVERSLVLWAFGENGLILQSLDQGNTWKRQHSDCKLRINSAFFIDENNGWLAGYGVAGITPQVPVIEFHTTNDGGNTWKKCGRLNSIQRTAPFIMKDLHFADSNRGWGVLHAYGADRIMQTSDGGQNWSPIDSEGSRYQSLFFLNNSFAWATGYDSATYWIKQVASPVGFNLQAKATGGHRLTDITFVDKVHGWAAGENGSLVKTEDGGRTWRISQHRLGQPNLVAVDFVDTKNGWIMSHGKSAVIIDGKPRIQSTLYGTNDGGMKWSELAKLRGMTDLRKIAFVDDKTGWVITNDVGQEDNGVIEHFESVISTTTDGGKTWQKQHGSNLKLDRILALPSNQ